ncbi:MAG: large subunit ribosomal protein [Patescibacteria group bacterium]|jgi:large subunit ribosomal protein L21|nr:large subunit ribosomal protein [Patescibacteria group bacterium]
MLAVIQAGNHQYLVEKGQIIETELLGEEKSVTFEPLLVVDGDNVKVGTPHVTGAKVVASVREADKQSDKVLVLKYKAKKRQKTMHGHRQHKTVLVIDSITA